MSRDSNKTLIDEGDKIVVMSQMHERLRQARKGAGFATAAEVAEKFGWNAAGYRHHENGTSGFKRDRALAYAEAFRVPVEWLLYGDDEPSPPEGGVEVLQNIKAVPILGDVAAGIWREVVTQDIDQPPKEYLNIFLSGYESDRLFALKVVGSSMNLFYPEGRYVICASPSEAGLRNHDHVVVQRSRSGLYETTIKELVHEDDETVVLWPRSNDPAYQTPIRYSRGDDASQDGLEIIGVVVADYSKRERHPG